MNRTVCAAKRARAARACLFAAALLVAAQANSQDYGDTPYVQTPQNVVDKMLEIAKVGPKDYVIDLGSGDGRMVITAAKRYGARGFGVDLDRRLVILANKLAAKAGVADRAVFYERDLYKTDISRATVLTIYLLPEVNLMVRPRLLATLKPGTRIVSHDYDMGEWTPDLSLVLDAPDKPVGRDFKSKVFYWVVPAKASGKWRWQLAANGRAGEFELTLNQMFQKIDGTLSVDGRTAKIEQAALNGTSISIEASVGAGDTVQRYVFSGRIVNDRIEGQARVKDVPDAQPVAWKARRTEAVEPAHMALKPPPPPPGSW
ncbi:MAG: class I SAM-dependent methyltransferase [Betaproteobacteria bacterium]|nr:class I SAM-dependent methyltransferase [Betaproteobacteria bacterium]